MIRVRKATYHDAEAIARYMLLAMEEIVYHFIGIKDPATAARFMLHFVERGNNQYSYQNCWVAENEMTVVAAINVYDGARLEELRQPVVDYIRTKFNKDFIPEDETQAGEFYIDSLGVNPTEQNKGIGTMLLKVVMDDYVTEHKLTIGLLVDDVNPGARKLYVNLGFESVGKKFLFGKVMEHLQIKG
jgi:ribosomal protein S18 acetylase RimI-like enzyme